MFEYSWMLVFVAINGLLTVGEMDSKEECIKAASQMEKVGLLGLQEILPVFLRQIILLKVVHMSEQFILNTTWKHENKLLAFSDRCSHAHASCYTHQRQRSRRSRTLNFNPHERLIV